jgi:Type I phosphodiesterase / nucleotide pyrophosphatase
MARYSSRCLEEENTGAVDRLAIGSVHARQEPGLLKRVVLIAAGVVFLAATLAYGLRPSAGAPAGGLRPSAGVPAGAPTESHMAQTLGSQIMDHILKGHVPGRSGDLLLVPKPNNYVIGEWDLGTLGSRTPWLASSHPNPWAYLTRIPLILYGPGYVPAHQTRYETVDAADLAPTYARLLGMKNFRAEGHPLREIASASSRPAPKAIVTVIVDGGGWNVLQQHVGSWPEIARLAHSGTSYENATNGSAPSITGAIHATFGTGDYPHEHGIPGNQLRETDGVIEDSWLHSGNPTFLRKPTISDRWDARTHNRAEVAAVAFEGWHLGMLGHGAQMPGGDKDIAAIWQEDTSGWASNLDYYSLPAYLRSMPLSTLRAYERRLDGRDGVADGTWFGHTLSYLRKPTIRPGTPAFVRFTGDAVNRVVARRSFGKDRVTDLLWVEYKAPDFAGHIWNMTSPEEGDVIKEVDRQIARLKGQLDRKLGRGNYLLAISADHGQQPLPDQLGGWRIDADELQADIDSRFGDVVTKVTPVDIYMKLGTLADNGYTVDDVARYLGTYTLGDNIPDGAAGSDRVPAARLGERLFAAAFSARYIESVPPEATSTFGPGAYAQSRLTVAPPTP